ncbi:MAG: hypothetical protein IJF94_02070 [Eubacterium sp.]|nr:hypothetical protein [Eubacterium sp.]
MKKILMGVLSLAVVVTMLFGTATMVFAGDETTTEVPTTTTEVPTMKGFDLKKIEKEDYPYGGDYNKLMLYWRYPEPLYNCVFKLQFKLSSEKEYTKAALNITEGDYVDVSQWEAGTYKVRIAAYDEPQTETGAVVNDDDHPNAGVSVKNPIVKIKDDAGKLKAVSDEQEVEITPKTTTAEVTTDATDGDDDGDDGDGSEVGSEVVEGTDDSDSSPETGQLIFMGVIGAMAISGGLGIYARRKFGKEE